VTSTANQTTSDDEVRAGVNTEDAAPAGTRVGPVPTSRIVRIAGAAGPLVAAAVVVATVAVAFPRDAWLPFASGPAVPAAWAQALAWPLDGLSRLQIALGSRLWPTAPVAGAIALMSLVGALSAAAMARSFCHAGLSPVLATLVALVAASAPLGSWQSASPLSGGSITALSAVALWFVARRPSWHLPRWVPLVGVVGPVIVGVASSRHGTPLLSAWHVIRGDLGWIGLLLMLLGLAGSRAATLLASGARADEHTLHSDVVLACAIALVLGIATGSAAGAALALPWAWWLVARGTATLLAWRGARVGRWAAVGLGVWVALNAGRLPWGHKRHQAALVRTWAEGLVDVPSTTQPLALERSARGHLVTALLRQKRAGHAAVVVEDEVRDAVAAGRRPIVLSGLEADRFRWSGIALAELPEPAGIDLDRLVDAMPRGTIVLAAISRAAAAQFTPTHWQALGRVGLRLPDAGSARAHALVGVTRARVEGQEVAQAGSARLDLVPGDPIGRTGARSPMDARIEADAADVRVWLHGRPLVATRGLVLVFFSTRGDVLGWRAGASPAQLDGSPLGPDPSTTALTLEALPCIDVEAGRDTDAAAAMGEPAVGVTLLEPGSLEVAVTRPEGFDMPATSQSPAAGAADVAFSATDGGFRIVARRASAVGVHFHGPVRSARVSSTARARVCAAWPALPAIDPSTRVDVQMSPEVEPSLAGGWHASESAGNGRSFRWMSGPRAGLLLSLRRPQALRFALDAQAVAAPGPGDVVRLWVNGRDVGSRPLLSTRGLYEWDIDAAALKAGVNTLTIETTQALRPAEHAAGADARLLGMAVHGWSFARAAGGREPAS